MAAYALTFLSCELSNSFILMLDIFYLSPKAADNCTLYAIVYNPHLSLLVMLL